MNESIAAQDVAPVEEWRLLDYSHPDPYFNMAVEEAVMHTVGARQAPPTLRLWQNNNALTYSHG